jgi:hypothetical protein
MRNDLIRRLIGMNPKAGSATSAARSPRPPSPPAVAQWSGPPSALSRFGRQIERSPCVPSSLLSMMAVNARPRPLAIVLALLLTAMLVGCERYALDRQMEELCKKDGGVTVYETVSLPGRYWDWANRVALGPSTADRSTDENRDVRVRAIADGQYELITDSLTLVDGDTMKGNGKLVRIEQRVVRTRDSKLLGMSVHYNRRGGDFIVIGHPSASSCPSPSPQVLSLFTRED